MESATREARFRFLHAGTQFHANPCGTYTVPAAQAFGLLDDELVLGVAVEGLARAYPIRYLSLTEHVNDALGRRTILVHF